MGWANNDKPLFTERRWRDGLDLGWEFRMAERMIAHCQGSPGFVEEEKTAVMVEQAIAALDKVIDQRIDPMLDRVGNEYLKTALQNKRTGGAKTIEVLEEFKRFLRRYKYWGPCPRCHGQTCGDCYGKGWVSVEMAARMRKEDRDAH